MIQYLENNQIDRKEWDTCIRLSSKPVPYAYSWYLDIMTPGWCALVDHQYQTVFPLPTRHRVGLKYIFIPPFMQSLGLFSRERSYRSRTEEFIGFIPDFYRFVDLCLINDPGDSELIKTERDNYTLSLKKDYNSISKGYSSDCRRNISLARSEKQQPEKGIEPAEAIELFICGPGKNISGISRTDYSRLEQLMAYTIESGIGDITGIRHNGKLIYSLFKILTSTQVTLLFTSTSNESRELRSGYMVIDSIIREYSGKDLVLDFAGSSIPSVADFIRSFGAKKETYYRIYRNNLPWPVNRFR